MALRKFQLPGENASSLATVRERDMTDANLDGLLRHVALRSLKVGVRVQRLEARCGDSSRKTADRVGVTTGIRDSATPCPSGLVELDGRGKLLRTALGFFSLEPREPELQLRRRCFDTWRGIGDVVRGMAWQDSPVAAVVRSPRGRTK